MYGYVYNHCKMPINTIKDNDAITIKEPMLKPLMSKYGEFRLAQTKKIYGNADFHYCGDCTNEWMSKWC